MEFIDGLNLGNVEGIKAQNLDLKDVKINVLSKVDNNKFLK